MLLISVSVSAREGCCLFLFGSTPFVQEKREKFLFLSSSNILDFFNDDSSVPLGAMSPQVTSSTKPPGVP